MFKQILASVAEQLVQEVRRHAGFKSLAELGSAADINAKTLTQYNKGRRGPTNSLDQLAEAAQLSAGQMGWMIGYLLEQKYHVHRFDLETERGEVREPQIPYGEPTLEERLELIMQLDFSGIEQDERIVLARARETLRQTCQHALDSNREQTTALKAQLAAFEDIYQFAVHRDKK